MCESELVCSEQIFTEFLAEIYRYLSTTAMALHKVEEVFVHNVPFLVLSSTFFLIVGEEIAFHLLMVKKVKLFVDERSDSHAAYCLGSLNHRAVELAFCIIPWLGKDVDAKIFSACHLHRFGIADGRVEVKIQGQASIGNGASE